MSFDLRDDDAEKGENTPFIRQDGLENHYNGAANPLTRNNVSKCFKSFGMFMLGAMFTVILLKSKDRFGQKGKYETGFAEEKLSEKVNPQIVSLELIFLT